VLFAKVFLDMIFGKYFIEDGHNDVHQRVQVQLEKIKAMYKARHVNHQFNLDFQVEGHVCLCINKKKLQD